MIRRCFTLCIRKFSTHLPHRSRYYNHSLVCDIIHDSQQCNTVSVKGWVRSVRKHKDVKFLHLSDGSCREHLQVIVKPELWTEGIVYGSAVAVEGMLEPSPGQQQAAELHATKLDVVGECDSHSFPFKARKRHPEDYVRQFQHLRPATNQFSALLRLRSAAMHYFHQHLLNEKFTHVTTPIITSNDCEGAGEVFQVQADKEMKVGDATLSDKGVVVSNDREDIVEGGGIPASSDKSARGGAECEDIAGGFFGTPAYLTVSGQLHLESMAQGLSRVYTFGPTFRADHSRGRYHLAEFYMLEAEIAFTDSQEDVMQIIEHMIQSVTTSILENHQSDLHAYHSKQNQHAGDRAYKLATSSFHRITYTEAISILEKNNSKFENHVKWGIDLHKEHERYLVTHCGETPVFVTDYPADGKPFYCRHNSQHDLMSAHRDNHQQTVSAFDLLCSDVGELVGGSLREERLHVLQATLAEQGVDVEPLQWYLDLRRYGSVPHGGFGLGFERYLQTILGITSIKDTIPFHRSYRNCKT